MTATTRRAILFVAILGIIVSLAVLSSPLNDSTNTSDILLAKSTQTLSGLVSPTIPNIMFTTNTPQPGSTLTTEPQATPTLSELQTSTPIAFSASEFDPTNITLMPDLPQNPLVPENWNPPPLPVPLARHPNDHYWFMRPVASNYRNVGLYWYPYGSDGANNDFLVHRGIDIANPVGVDIYAAGDGVVIWSGLGHRNRYENITAYGNAVVIEHDVGYLGKPVYTLYAHLSSRLVSAGDRVNAGDRIGLIGDTGQTTGPHVHFEVRIDKNTIYATRNPDLWIAPYSGTGVLAGRIAYTNNRVVLDADITIKSIATGKIVYRTTTYSDSAINSDDKWQENFVIPNLPVGEYSVTAQSDTNQWYGEVSIAEGLTNWVDMKFVPRSTSP